MERARVQICRGFTVEQWDALRTRLDADDVKAWHVAIDVFARRMRERYLSSIEALLSADSGASADVEVPPGAPADGSTLPSTSSKVVPGFSIIALCCLLIETIHSFRVGASKRTKEQFKAFLQRPDFGGGAFVSDKVADSFVVGVRHGVLHEGETRQWVLWRDDPKVGLVEHLGGDRYALNRTAFYQAVKADFDAYCGSVAEGDPALRRCFREQMEDMLRLC